MATILYILMALAITMMVRIAAPVTYEDPPVMLVSLKMSLLSTLRSLWHVLHGMQWLFRKQRPARPGMQSSDMLIGVSRADPLLPDRCWRTIFGSIQINSGLALGVLFGGQP